MWFTKNDDGFRAWFTVADKTGVLRTGALPAHFIATVIDPTGVTPTVLAVSESAGKPGIYTFLVPASFFTTHGIGGYGVVVEANITTSPKVSAVFGEVLRVFDNDFDSLAVTAQAAEYLGAIHIDTRNGSAGAVAGINGTPGNPVNNLADAVTLAAALGLREYQITGPITLTSAHPDWRFVGTSADASVDVNGQNVSNSLFSDTELTGAIGTGPVVVIGGTVNNVSNLEGQVTNAAIEGTITLGAAGAVFSGSYNGNADGTAITIDTNNTASFSAGSFSGDMIITNVTAPGQDVNIGMTGGNVTLDASNTGGSVTVGGIGDITDNSTGTTVVSSLFSPAGVWQEILDGTVTAQEIMKRVNAMARGKISLTGATAKPAQDAIYYDEAGAPLFTNRNTGDERNPL